MKSGARILFLILTFGAAAALSAQQPGQTPARGQRVRVIHAMELLRIQEGPNTIQKLNKNVELRQDEVFMYCDSAIIENDIRVNAYGNVLIQQGDSIQVFADTLLYDASTRIAILDGNVILVNSGQKLFTDALEYDLNTRIARYFSGATLVSDSLQLSSKRGTYFARDREVYFQDSVVVLDPKFSLKAEALKYLPNSRTVVFQGPTLISTDSSKIYCESGYYNTEEGRALFATNPQYLKEDQTAVADSILYDDRQKVYELIGNARVEDSTRLAVASYIRVDEISDFILLRGEARYREGLQDIQSEEINYNQKTKTYSTVGRSLISDPPQLLEADTVNFSEETSFGRASGNVIWRDTSAQYTILCAIADYNKSSEYIKAYGGLPGRPELINMLDGDSLFLSADTLVSFRPDSTEADTSRRVLAYGQVRMYKSNFQAVCDSLAYSEQDSLFILYGNPVIWSDTSQFTGDTVYMRVRNDQVDQIELRNNGFIVVVSDGVYFNQIKGRTILAYLTEGKLSRLDASGNAEVIYYAKDESEAYVGVNQTSCSEMVIRLVENQIQRITFLAQPASKLLPMGQTDHTALRLKGFQYIDQGRPLRREDIYAYVVQRGKEQAEQEEE